MRTASRQSAPRMPELSGPESCLFCFSASGRDPHIRSPSGISEAKVVHFHVPLDISDFPTRHHYVLGLWQNRIECILADWVGELAVPIYRARSGPTPLVLTRSASWGIGDGRVSC